MENSKVTVFKKKLIWHVKKDQYCCAICVPMWTKYSVLMKIVNKLAAFGSSSFEKNQDGSFRNPWFLTDWKIFEKILLDSSLVVRLRSKEQNREAFVPSIFAHRKLSVVFTGKNLFITIEKAHWNWNLRKMNADGVFWLPLFYTNSAEVKRMPASSVEFTSREPAIKTMIDKVNTLAMEKVLFENRKVNAAGNGSLVQHIIYWLLK